MTSDWASRSLVSMCKKGPLEKGPQKGRPRSVVDNFVMSDKFPKGPKP